MQIALVNIMVNLSNIVVMMVLRSVPKTPQHNGVAKRMNRTICEQIKCMLSYSKLPRRLFEAKQ